MKVGFYKVLFLMQAKALELIKVLNYSLTGVIKRNLTSLENTTGTIETVRSTGIIPLACAIKPIADINIATIPQENPFIKPPIILLY